MKTDNNTDTAKDSTGVIVEDEWMIRPTNVYEEEYKECTSFKGRFNQYFIFGKTLDCTQWKRDADNCYRWMEYQDGKAGREVVESETLRRKARLGPHYANNVWAKRKTPPENWNCPLPDYLLNEYEHSYLNIKAQEIRGEITPTIDPSNVCSIM